MDRPRFVLFGPDHVAALALMAVAAAAAVRVVRRHPDGVTARRLQIALATAAPALWACENVVAAAEGWLTLQIGLPLQLCDVALFLAAAALLTNRQQLVEPLYFFALAGTVPALLTPELDEGFPDFRFLIYFLPHGLTVVSTLVLVLGRRLVPRPGAWWRAVLLLNAYAAIIVVVNAVL